MPRVTGYVELSLFHKIFFLFMLKVLPLAPLFIFWKGVWKEEE